jgi:hypothetical protein
MVEDTEAHKQDHLKAEGSTFPMFYTTRLGNKEISNQETDPDTADTKAK